MIPAGSRKHYLDNVRSFTILLLFPFHIFMIYNNWGEHFYIHGEALLIPSIFHLIVNFWMMPLLFAVAGISSRYALEKRSTGEYIKERVYKLLLPFIFGVLLIVPVQPYLAGIFWNGEAGYLDSFTKLTDFSGYDGAFALGHLWFLLFLFGISMVSLPLIIWHKKKRKETCGDTIPLIFVVVMGLLPCIGSLLKIGGQSTKSPTEYLAYFLLSYFFLSNEKLLEKLEKYRFWLFGLFVIYAAFTLFISKGEFYELLSWISILVILGMAQHHLNFNGKITGYLSKSSFGVYLFHQSWVVITAFFIFKFTNNSILQILLIFLSAIILTYGTYEICRRVFIFRLMFGLK